MGEKEFEVRITQLLNDLDESKEQNEQTQTELQQKIKNLTVQTFERQRSVMVNEIVSDANTGFDMFDSLEPGSQSRPQTLPVSPNKNQTIIDKKVLQKMRKKSELYTTVLTKARNLKQKNKDLKDALAKQSDVKADDEWKEKYAQLQSENEDLEEKFNEMETKLENQQFDLEEANEKAEELEDERDKLQKIIKNKKKSLTILEEQMDELKAYKNKFEELTDTVDQVKDALSVEDGVDAKTL